MKEVEVLMKYKENQEKDCLGLLENKVFQGKGILATGGRHFNISSFLDFHEKRSPPPHRNTGGLPSFPVALWRLTKFSEVNLGENAGHAY